MVKADIDNAIDDMLKCQKDKDMFLFCFCSHGEKSDQEVELSDGSIHRLCNLYQVFNTIILCNKNNMVTFFHIVIFYRITFYFRKSRNVLIYKTVPKWYWPNTAAKTTVRIFLH